MHGSSFLSAAAGFSAALGICLAGAASADGTDTLAFPVTYPEPAASNHSDINGIKLFHAEWGQGEPVILLHGGLASIEAWSNQIPVIAEEHRVIAIDSRGHGRSTRDEQAYSYSLMASDVIALMDQMSIDNATILGWSDGGIIALEMAVNHPERINKAWVIGTNYNTSGVDPSVENNPTFGEYVGRAAEHYGNVSPTPKEFDGFVGEILQMWGTLPAFSEDQLRSIDTPFTVVQALNDEAIKTEHAKEMAALLPGSTYIELQDLSHFALWQDPNQLNGLIIQFLAEQVPTSKVSEREFDASIRQIKSD